MLSWAAYSCKNFIFYHQLCRNIIKQGVKKYYTCNFLVSVIPNTVVMFNYGQTVWQVSDDYGLLIMVAVEVLGTWWWKRLSHVSVIDSNWSHAVVSFDEFSVTTRTAVNLLELWCHPYTKLLASYNSELILFFRLEWPYSWSWNCNA